MPDHSAICNMWERRDSNPRTPKRPDLQSGVFNHFTTCPLTIFNFNLSYERSITELTVNGTVRGHSLNFVCDYFKYLFHFNFILLHSVKSEMILIYIYYNNTKFLNTCQSLPCLLLPILHIVHHNVCMLNLVLP